MLTEQYVSAQNFLAFQREELRLKLQDEQGEIASQAIVMAMLVGIAVLIIAAKGDLTTIAGKITDGISSGAAD